MTMELNATGDGPTRYSHDWKMWKSAARKRAREKKELAGLEKKLIELTGSIAVAGRKLPEAGLNEEIGEASVANTEEVTAAADEFVLADKATFETEEGPSENEEILMIEVKAPVPRKQKKKLPKILCSVLFKMDGRQTGKFWKILPEPLIMWQTALIDFVIFTRGFT
ncbi:hypothetical protein JTB14_007562 [Gonioctena quinquepunctata]|nr:hypothetical protein JTB14_007562 [Gonioctena quinquepunctata]